MLKKIIYRLFRSRHFWREAGFDELSELYVSQLLRSLALNIIGIFVPVYLYKLGNSIQTILWFYVCWFAFQSLISIANGYIVARIGPKHSMALATLINAFYLTLLLTVTELSWPLSLIAIVGSWGQNLFVVAFDADFSKVKHADHGGKEVGYITMFEKVGAIAGPLIGGLLANFFDPRYTITLAIVVLLGSLVPLFKSGEPLKVHQPLNLKDFKWARYVGDYVTGVAFGIENNISLLVWPLFISVAIFTTDTYAKLGVVTAIGTASAIISAHIIGRLIDKRRGGILLSYSVVANAAVHLLRLFVKSTSQALSINLINEPFTAGYRIPYIKGFYDRADSLGRERIAYIVSYFFFTGIFRFLIFFGLWFASFLAEGLTLLRYSFILGAMASLVIGLQRFPALKNE